MATLKCKMCGGNLILIDGSTVAECEFCGSRQTVPAIDNDKKQKLYDRANKLRFNCDFDKAAGVYESIVNEFPDDAESYWGLILCKYGIEYVDDPATGKKIPTCHRSSYDSVMDDPDFEMVMENADSEARGLYRQEAKQIEELRKSILEVSGKEEPYDIFICYKETDDTGSRTIDSVLAQDVYDALTNKGYRVFFSRISLEDKLGTEYEPYIFAALNSAKLMLAIGTSYDNYNAVWVKNEWSRFLKLMAVDKEKYLIPCFKDIDAYDIPKEFAKFQAQDMGKVGAIQDLLRGINKLLGGKESVNVDSQNKSSDGRIEQADAAVALGILALKSGNKDKAVGFFEDALRIKEGHVGAYFGLVRTASNEKTAKPYIEKLEQLSVEDIKETIKRNDGILGTPIIPSKEIDEHVIYEKLIKDYDYLLEKLMRFHASTDLIEKFLVAEAAIDLFSFESAIVDYRDPGLVQLFIDKGANPSWEYRFLRSDGQNGYIWSSALAIAVKIEHYELCQILINAGADVNYIRKDYYETSNVRYSREEYSILYMAVKKGNERIIKLLLDKEIDYTIGYRWVKFDKKENNYTDIISEVSLLSVAIVFFPKLYFIDLLLQKKADPNIKEKRKIKSDKYDGMLMTTPFVQAVLYSDIEIVQRLLEYGANPETVYKCDYKQIYNNSQYITEVPVLETAIGFDRIEAVQALIQAGATMNQTIKQRVNEQNMDLFTIKECTHRVISNEMQDLIKHYGWIGHSGKLVKKNHYCYYLRITAGDHL